VKEGLDGDPEHPEDQPFLVWEWLVVEAMSAHDFRRSFGTRWARRVMPAVLQRLMRHESIETTMTYYVDLDADELAEELWKAHQGADSRVETRVSPRLTKQAASHPCQGRERAAHDRSDGR
jgi:hypothetical protein